MVYRRALYIVSVPSVPILGAPSSESSTHVYSHNNSIPIYYIAIYLYCWCCRYYFYHHRANNEIGIFYGAAGYIILYIWSDNSVKNNIKSSSFFIVFMHKVHWNRIANLLSQSNDLFSICILQWGLVCWCSPRF